MRLVIELDEAGLTKTLNQYKTEVVGKAAERAGKRTVVSMRAYTVKKMGQEYRLKAGVAKKNIYVVIYKPGEHLDAIEGEMVLPNQGLPFLAYGARQSKKGGYVMEFKKGNRHHFKHIFKAKMRSGHEGIFERESGSRLPIKELFSSSAKTIFKSPGFSDDVLNYSRKRYINEFEWALEHFGKKAA